MLKKDLALQLAGSETSLYFRQLMRHSKADLEARVARRAAIRHTATVEVGSVHRFDFQADVFRGEYRVTAFDDKTGAYTAEYLEPSDELIAEAEDFYLNSPSPYLGYHDPFGPERRQATRQEALDTEILERIERAGQTFKIRFVSAETYAAAF